MLLGLGAGLKVLGAGFGAGLNGLGLRVSKGLGLRVSRGLGAGLEKALGLGLGAEKFDKFERFIFLFKS